MELKEKKKGLVFKGWYPLLVWGTLTIAIAAVAVIFRNEIGDFQQYGYLGAFLISIMSAATIILYIPGVPMIFTLGGVLNPFYVGLAAGLGETIGELPKYFAGRGGHTILKERYAGFFGRIESWIRKRGYLTIFVSSVVFNPLYPLISTTAGAMRFPLWKFFLLAWAGKTVKMTAVALLGYLGLSVILRWFGIGT